MKLQHLELKGKDSFSNKLNGTLQSIIKDSQDQLTCESDYSKSNVIELFDRVGRFHLHDFSKNNICIIGDEPEAVYSFSNKLLSKLNDRPCLEEDIRGNVFFTRLFTPDSYESRLLIKVSGLVKPSFLSCIIKSCGTICILPLVGSKIISPLDGTVTSSRFAKERVKALGGNQELRELLIASLSKKEFLLIENAYFHPCGGKESVRCFFKN